MSLVLPRANTLKLDSGKMMFIQNNTSAPLFLPDGRTPLLRYGGIFYPLASGEKDIVPFALISLLFGDPRSRPGLVQKYKDSTGEGFIQSREAELDRISVFWGVYEQGIADIGNVVPDVTITTLQNQEVIPPCFDPHGDVQYGFEKGDIDTQAGAAGQLAQMQEQMDQLRAEMEAMRQRGDNDADVEEDLPTHPALSEFYAGGVPAPSSP
jgi:hypothetical protein